MGEDRGRGRRGRDASRALVRETLQGIHSVREALRAGRRPCYRLRVASTSRRAGLHELVALARKSDIPVVEDQDLDGASGAQAQGVSLECGPLPVISIGELLRSEGGDRTLVALDGVNDPQNVGAIARVAEAAGIQGLILTDRRAPPLGPAVARASAGAIEWLRVARVPNLGRALDQARQKGFWIFGTDVDAPESLFALPDRAVSGNRIVVLGAEGRGLRPGVLKRVDYRVGIPMQGRVDSLNVAAAAAIVLFELGRRARGQFPM